VSDSRVKEVKKLILNYRKYRDITETIFNLNIRIFKESGWLILIAVHHFLKSLSKVSLFDRLVSYTQELLLPDSIIKSRLYGV